MSVVSLPAGNSLRSYSLSYSLMPRPYAGLEGPAKEIIIVPEEQPSVPDTVPDSFPEEAPVDPTRQPEVPA